MSLKFTGIREHSGFEKSVINGFPVGSAPAET